MPAKFVSAILALTAALAAVSLAVGGCVQESQTDRRQQTTTAPAQPASPDTPAQASQPADTTTTTSLPPEGLISDVASVQVGNCFNDYRFENERTSLVEIIFTIVDCRRPHQGEVYHQAEHPASDFPGANTLNHWAQQECYLYFEDWVGREYELSELDFLTFLPTEELWSQAQAHSRRLSCYLVAPDGEMLVGSQRGAGV